MQKAVNESCQKRHSDVARRKEVLLGTNQYPNINETAASKIEIDGACHCGCAAEKGPNALCGKRAATDFEELRLSTEAAAKRPKVFMLTIGNLAMRLARAQFSTNFFGCAGYEIIDNLGFNTVEEGVDAALAKNFRQPASRTSSMSVATFSILSVISTTVFLTNKPSLQL